MFSRKKLAAVSALLGGLAVTCTGATQAYAGGSAGTCSRDIQGNMSCMQRGDEGRYVVHQTQNCQGTKPLEWPAPGLLNKGSTQVGPAVSCSNSAPSAPPQVFEAPQILG
ncbi:hypothetical protein [Streptomyces gilvosporeus]|uniref:Uncharacterized protein n=1 Tax=Streptomyces gilvosporeus TaxID=553510 RepID=A0A1V0TRA7_9ACTN|nr:hypothetical protein [Streptomyces gilvosporeus]ARF55380.1 hypothetical protein B1H19_15360 [Streptomyces gilvosporeus]